MVGAGVARVNVVDPLLAPRTEMSHLAGKDASFRTRTHDLGRGDPLLDSRRDRSPIRFLRFAVACLLFCLRFAEPLFTFSIECYLQ